MSGSPPLLHPSPLTLAVLETASALLVTAVEECAKTDSFEPLIQGVAEVVEAVGVTVDRVQLPLNRIAGFRHPIYIAILATWRRGAGVEVILRRHESGMRGTLPELRVVFQNSPYYPLMFEGQGVLRQDLTASALPDVSIYPQLVAEGYVDYLAVGLTMPGGSTQLLSLAARAPMPADAPQRILALRPILALAIYGAYSASAARQVATTYIGRSSGLEVLSGDLFRGHTRTVQAGILFTDLRGFTAMTDRIGAAPMVTVLNEVFDTIGALVEAHDGEILKFIGDAMLVIFPITPARPREDVAASMVALAEEGLSAIDGLSRENQPLRLGFGGHIGQVELGNIGTMSRLDFTVIGSAVNLASRLEGLCGVLGEPAVFSAAVAEVVGLRTLGAHRLKGVAEPMEAFGLPQPRARA